MLQFLCNLKILSSFKFGKIRCNMNDHPERPNWNSKMFFKKTVSHTRNPKGLGEAKWWKMNTTM